MTRFAAPRWLLPMLTLAAGAAAAQALRDPMLPPAAVRAARAPVAAVAAEPASAPSVHQLLIVGDQRWVVDQGRKRGVGDLLGTARIERIEDAAVVVRDGGTLRRLPLFGGVVKQAPALPAPGAASAPPSTSTARTALAGTAGADRPRP